MNTYKTSKAKENILRRIRTLKGQGSLPIPYPEVEKASVNKVLAPQNQSREETFAQEFAALGGKFVYCQNEKELADQLRALFKTRGWKSMVCAHQPFHTYLEQAGIPVQTHLPSAQDQEVPACLTPCEYLLARTGTIVLSSAQREGRTATIFPPVHLVLAHADQLVDDLGDAFTALKKKYPKSLPSMINLTTGPSRTADIEKTLVVGVHGPGEIFCFFLDQQS